MKILTVIGARPQFVKAAVVSRALQQKKNMQEIIVHTGQHYDNNMSDIFFTEMDIPAPAYNLAVQETLHGAMTAKMLTGIETVIIKEKPAVVLVYGDTNSTLAASLAASKLHVAVAHVEAGLRSYNMQMPEEINRIVTDKISSFLFCPTEQAVKNLRQEGYENDFNNIFYTGDVMFDAALFYFGKSNNEILKKLKLIPENYILATIHRAENTDNTHHLASIIEALNELHRRQTVAVPLHPRTAKLIKQEKLKPSFTIIEPVGYFDMLQLLANCSLVITDSGGLQKEAYFFKKFCVVMREQTEWVELLHNGCCALAGSSKGKITDIAEKFLMQTFSEDTGLYGNGEAGEKIADILERKVYSQ